MRFKQLVIISFTLLISFIFSCKKDDGNDFRNKYIGKYKVHERISSYGSPSCGEPYNYEKDTVISVNYGSTDSTLSVLNRDVLLDSDGNYYAYHYGLRMWNDSISSNFMNGGLGCGEYVVHIGYKISDTP